MNPGVEVPVSVPVWPFYSSASLILFTSGNSSTNRELSETHLHLSCVSLNTKRDNGPSSVLSKSQSSQLRSQILSQIFCVFASVAQIHVAKWIAVGVAL